MLKNDKMNFFLCILEASEGHKDDTNKRNKHKIIVKH